MLTRLKVNGFKNLVDIDVRFGPFTCIAGVNGVGKSNLFDAIRFLSALADRTLIDAALSIRGEGGGLSDVRGLFHRTEDDYAKTMEFEAEMIIPSTGIDDLGQKAEASTTFLRYSLALAYRLDTSARSLGALEIIHESLEPINISDAEKNLLFAHTPLWSESIIKGRQRSTAFISTTDDGRDTVIHLYEDGVFGSSGRSQPRLAATLPRTVLSATNAAESPTALLARREMQSWRRLQLEPSALRKSDEFTAPTKLGDNGEYLASTLYELAHTHINPETKEPDADQIYVTLANNLSGLIGNVSSVIVDRDDKREQLTLYLIERNMTSHSARSLSDGTLRFLALSVLELDSQSQGLICLEEPENGIYPGYIPAVIKLLQRIATDVTYPVDEDNSLRQVIITTHSPMVVQLIDEESILFAELRPGIRDTKRFNHVQFSPLSGTWRAKHINDRETIRLGNVITYLNPSLFHREMNGDESEDDPKRRVIDRQDVKELVQFVIHSGETE